ncbi:hypothetical protein AAV30_01940 [Bacillus velezensis]|nr:hypothetical protein AAV30_01940 [Bacillus velezensis]
MIIGPLLRSAYGQPGNDDRCDDKNSRNGAENDGKAKRQNKPRRISCGGEYTSEGERFFLGGCPFHFLSIVTKARRVRHRRAFFMM